jgi:hypothetical protein
MAISRFYQPVQQQYVSQFIPEDMRMYKQILDQKQAKQDANLASLDAYGDEFLGKKSLGWHDTKVLGEKRDAFQAEAARLTGTDVSSGQGYRDVQNLIRKYKTDEDLQKIQAAYDWDIKAKENIDKLKAAGHYDEEIDFLYKQARNEYIKEDGKGFKGTGLLDNAFVKHTQRSPLYESMVNNLKAHGYSKDTESGTWIHTQSGEYIKPKELKAIFDQNYNSFITSSAGKQLQVRAHMNGLTPKQQYEMETNPVISEYTVSTHKTSMKDNTARQERLKKMKDETATPVYKRGYTTSKTGVMGLKTFGEIDDKIAELQETANYQGKDPIMSSFAQKAKKDIAILESEKKNVYKSVAGELGGKYEQFANTSTEQMLNDPASLPYILNSMKSMQSNTWLSASALGLNEDSLEKYTNMSTEEQLAEIENLKKTYNLSDTQIKTAAEQGYAKANGIDINDFYEKANDFVAQDKIVQGDAILFDLSKGGNDYRKNVAQGLASYVDNAGWSLARGGEEAGSQISKNGFTVEQLVQNADPGSLQILDNNDSGLEIVFTTKGDGKNAIPAETVSITPNNPEDLFNPSSALYTLTNTMVSDNQASFEKLRSRYLLKDLAPIHPDVEYNMMGDLGNTLNKYIQSDILDKGDVQAVSDYFEQSGISDFKVANVPGSQEIQLMTNAGGHSTTFPLVITYNKQKFPTFQSVREALAFLVEYAKQEQAKKN